MSHFNWHADSQLLINCLIQAGNKTDAIVGIHDRRLKIKITAPATEGKANRHLITLFSRWCGVPSSRVNIVKGLTSRQKTIAIVEPKMLPAELKIEAELCG
ncbi:DUF167 domain-containing protein [Aurantivibrio infirmus]